MVPRRFFVCGVSEIRGDEKGRGSDNNEERSELRK